MAVLKIKVISMIGRMSELDHVAAVCGRSGVFHPDNSLSFYSDTSGFSPLNEENPYAGSLQILTDAIASIRKKPVMLDEEATASYAGTLADAKAYALSFSSCVSDLQRQRVDAQKKVEELSQSISKISHFVGMNLDLDEVHACDYIKARFGCLPRESYEKLNSFSENPYVIFFPCSNDAQYYWGVYFSPIEQVTEVDRIFSSLFFERVRLTEMTGTPETAVEEIRRQRQEQLDLIQQLDARIEKYWNVESQQANQVFSWLTEKSTYFTIRKYAARYHDNFVLTGWIPADEELTFRQLLDPIDSVEYTFDAAENEMIHSPPVKLKNKKPFRPFEFFVDLYGLPAYDEVDPTAFVAMTYILLFGIMFGDLGQGLCVSLVGYLMWRFKKMALGRILIPCGISSAFFGLIFGSVFGFEEALNPLYHALFGLEEKPVEVMDPFTTNMIIYSAVGLGIILVMIAILINIYSSLKRHRYESALFGPNGVAGFVFYASLTLGFGLQLITGKTIVTLPYVVCLIIFPLVVISFREVLGDFVEHKPHPLPEKWGEFIMQNFFEVFEFLLSYASNTISFLRVGAFVLVHAGMMVVVFTLAGMSSGIGYVLIVVIGNAFIMGLEGLLVGIQVLRLEFYEMFSRFFDGDGRPFVPVTVRRKD